jgi:PIN domain nuclease of toxin-antitoxin system
MRYLLDTNIVAFFITSDFDNLTNETQEILNDYNNQLSVSSVAVVELLQLFRLGKIKPKKYKTADDLHNCIENEFYIKILPFAKEHTSTLSKLKIESGHNDPFDHSIISHAITEKMTLVSSDKKFQEYTSQKFLFSFNKR